MNGVSVQKYCIMFDEKWTKIQNSESIIGHQLWLIETESSKNLTNDLRMNMRISQLLIDHSFLMKFMICNKSYCNLSIVEVPIFLRSSVTTKDFLLWISVCPYALCLTLLNVHSWQYCKPPLSFCNNWWCVWVFPIFKKENKSHLTILDRLFLVSI